ncbi:HEAT repeat protein [Apiospora phragmitis]|uniref:HEAT repeat protein n=1 Tax=Apiospora phragmitis TaxID=2905665 RepID=A0ABR1TRN5_9PEZI
MRFVGWASRGRPVLLSSLLMHPRVEKLQHLLLLDEGMLSYAASIADQSTKYFVDSFNSRRNAILRSRPPFIETEFFQELKPRCIKINNLAVRSADKRGSAKELLDVTQDLSSVLDQQVAKDPTVLDEKIAEYVFFPLSNILRHQQDYPVRLTETTIKCLRILVQYGWKSKISTELSRQLIILFTFIVGGVPGKERKQDIPEETKLETLGALKETIKATGATALGAASLTETDALPSLGHTITVILGMSTDGNTADIQLEALLCVEAVFASLRDAAALATVLPGTVSSLTRLLTPPTALKTSRKVLVKGIAALKSVLIGVLGDVKIRSLLKKPSEEDDAVASEGKVLTPAWLRATADQIKLALSNVLKLRNHKFPDVQEALERFCVALLDECHESLTNCTYILVESTMVLSSDEENKSLISTGLNTTLADLVGIYPELTDTVKTIVYNWVTSLPRLMQASDEDVKRQAIQNLLKGQRLMNDLRIDSSTLSITLASSLRDSVIELLALKKSTSQLTEVPSNDLIHTTSDLARSESGLTFRPTLLTQTTQKATREALMNLVFASGSFVSHSQLAREMINYVRESTGNSQVASYWLSLELVRSGLAQNSDIDEFLDFSSMGSSGDDHEQLLQELYSFSVSILGDTDEEDETDWRVQALALETTTFAALRMGKDFRPELIDVLYPIATFMGSAVPQLREHAVIALNSIATACGYPNVADLVIDNVDYMLNSISLRLNTFDISPASTQVLNMMINLTGPKLVPFLGDVVDSIFAALDNYHGYPLFVENLFNVLAEIVVQGSKSNILLLEDASRPKLDHRKKRPEPVALREVEEFLDRRQARKRRRDAGDDSEQLEIHHPKKPWKDAEADETKEEEKKKNRTTSRARNTTSPPRPPPLRKSLLDLLATVCPALSPDEDAFLPLVHVVWPVLLARLYDDEPFVVTAACRALAALFAGAGDFLGSRVKTEWWDGLGKWCAKTKAKYQSQSQSQSHRGKTGGGGGGGYNNNGSSSSSSFGAAAATIKVPIRTTMTGELGNNNSSSSPSSLFNLRESAGVKDPGGNHDASSIMVPSTGTSSSSAGISGFTQVAQIWSAVQDMLVALISFVRIEDTIFEQILDLLLDSLASASSSTSVAEAREALEAVNADAVWLALYEYSRRTGTKASVSAAAAQQLKIPRQRPDSVDGIRFVEV